MTTKLAEHQPAEVQKFVDASGREVLPYSTFCVPFELVKGFVESAPAPKRPIRNRPIHDSLSDEMAAWDEASDELLEQFDQQFPPVED
jgi:hypothetical protein